MATLQELYDALYKKKNRGLNLGQTDLENNLPETPILGEQSKTDINLPLVADKNDQYDIPEQIESEDPKISEKDEEETKNPISINSLSDSNEGENTEENNKFDGDKTEKGLVAASGLSSVMQEILAKRQGNITGKDPTVEINQIRAGQKRLEDNLARKDLLKQQLEEKLAERKQKDEERLQTRQDLLSHRKAIESTAAEEVDVRKQAQELQNKKFKEETDPTTESAKRWQTLLKSKFKYSDEDVANLPAPIAEKLYNGEIDLAKAKLNSEKLANLPSQQPNDTATQGIELQVRAVIGDPTVPVDVKEASKQILNDIQKGKKYSQAEADMLGRRLSRTGVGTRTTSAEREGEATAIASIKQTNDLNKSLDSAENKLGRNLLVETLWGKVEDKIQALQGAGMSEQAKQMADLNAQIELYSSAIRNQLFGATLTKNEYESARKFLPTQGDSLETVRIKLKQGIQQLKNKTAGRLSVMRGQGQVPPPELEEFVKDNLENSKQIPIKTNIPELSQKDQEALNWANSNPNDPRARAIKKKLGR